PSGENKHCLVVLGPRSCRLSRKMKQVSEPVLRVSQLHLIPQPGPVEIRIGSQHPGQGFDEPRIEIRLGDRTQYDFSRVSFCIPTNMFKSRIAECGQLTLQIVRPGRPSIERVA